MKSVLRSLIFAIAFVSLCVAGFFDAPRSFADDNPVLRCDKPEGPHAGGHYESHFDPDGLNRKYSSFTGMPLDGAPPLTQEDIQKILRCPDARKQILSQHKSILSCNGPGRPVLPGHFLAEEAALVEAAGQRCRQKACAKKLARKLTISPTGIVRGVLTAVCALSPLDVLMMSECTAGAADLDSVLDARRRDVDDAYYKAVALIEKRFQKAAEECRLKRWMAKPDDQIDAECREAGRRQLQERISALEEEIQDLDSELDRLLALLEQGWCPTTEDIECKVNAAKQLAGMEISACDVCPDDCGNPAQLNNDSAGDADSAGDSAEADSSSSSSESSSASSSSDGGSSTCPSVDSDPDECAPPEEGESTEQSGTGDEKCDDEELCDPAANFEAPEVTECPECAPVTPTPPPECSVTVCPPPTVTGTPVITPTRTNTPGRTPTVLPPATTAPTRTVTASPY